MPGRAFLVLALARLAWVPAGARRHRASSATLGARRVVEDEPLRRTCTLRVRRRRAAADRRRARRPARRDARRRCRPGAARTVRGSTRASPAAGAGCLAPAARRRPRPARPAASSVVAGAAATRSSCFRASSRSARPATAAAATGGAAARGPPGGSPPRSSSTALRQHRAGTPASRIYWPSLARGGELSERRLRADADTRPLVVLDPRGAAADAERPRRRGPRRRVARVRPRPARAAARSCFPGDRRARRPGRDARPAGRTLHVRLALVDRRGCRAVARPALVGPRRADLLRHAAARRRDAARACRRRRRAGSRILVVPGALPGRRALFAVAGCHGYELREARAGGRVSPRRPAPRERRRPPRAAARRAPAAGPGRRARVAARSSRSRSTPASALGAPWWSRRQGGRPVLTCAAALAAGSRWRGAPPPPGPRHADRRASPWLRRRARARAARRRRARLRCSADATGASCATAVGRRARGAARASACPYRGLDEWVRIVILGGAGLLAVLAAALARAGAGAPARRRRRAVLCRSSTAIPVVQRQPRLARSFTGRSSPCCSPRFLAPSACRRRRGAAGRRRRARRPSRALGALARAAPGLDADARGSTTADSPRPRRRATRPRSTGTTATGPLDWPRDGREVLRCRAAASRVLEDDGLRALRRPALGTPPRVRPRRADTPSCPATHWREDIEVTVRGLRTEEFVTAGFADRHLEYAPARVERGTPARSSPARRPLDARRHLQGAPSTSRGPRAASCARRAPRTPTSCCAARCTLPGPRRERARVGITLPARGATDARARPRSGGRSFRIDRRRRQALDASRYAPGLRPGPAPARGAPTAVSTSSARVAGTGCTTARRYTESPPAQQGRVPLDALPLRRPRGLLPAVLGRHGAAAAHGRRARARRVRASRPARSTPTRASTSSATSTRTPGSRRYFPQHRLGDLRPDAGRRAGPRARSPTARQRGRRHRAGAAPAPAPPATGRRRAARPRRAGADAGGGRELPRAGPGRDRRRARRPARRPRVVLALAPAPAAARARELTELRRALARRGRPVAPELTLAGARARAPGYPRGRRLPGTLRSARCARHRAEPTPAGRRALRRALADGRGLRGRLAALRALPPRRAARPRARAREPPVHWDAR